MTKETYVIELRKRLSLLNDSEVDSIIGEYNDYIKQKVASGITEGLAVEQMGDVNTVAKEILRSYKINDRFIKLFIGKEKVIDELGEFANKVTEASTTIFHRIEDSLNDLSKSTVNVAKKTYKFGEERINDVKKIFKKNDQESKQTEDSQ